MLQFDFLHKELNIKKGNSLCFFLHFIRPHFSISLHHNQKHGAHLV